MGKETQKVNADRDDSNSGLHLRAPFLARNSSRRSSVWFPSSIAPYSSTTLSRLAADPNSALMVSLVLLPSSPLSYTYCVKDKHPCRVALLYAICDRIHNVRQVAKQLFASRFDFLSGLKLPTMNQFVPEIACAH